MQNQSKNHQKSQSVFSLIFLENPLKNVEKARKNSESTKNTSATVFGGTFWATGAILDGFWGPFGILFGGLFEPCLEKLGEIRPIGCFWVRLGRLGSISCRFWVDFGSILGGSGVHSGRFWAPSWEKFVFFCLVLPSQVLLYAFACFHFLRPLSVAFVCYCVLLFTRASTSNHKQPWATKRKHIYHKRAQATTRHYKQPLATKSNSSYLKKPQATTNKHKQPQATTSNHKHPFIRAFRSLLLR